MFIEVVTCAGNYSMRSLPQFVGGLLGFL